MAAATTQDMHVHSTFSDGADTLEANVAEAEAIGLVELTCVDHVAASTDWLPDYTAAVARLGIETPLALHCGIEVDVLDTGGRLDLPAGELTGVDWIYAADHRVPLDDGPHDPAEVREGLARGRYRAEDVIAALTTATRRCLTRNPARVVIAHLFDVLPRLGLGERDVPLERVEGLAAVTYATGNRIEVNERHRTPSADALRPFARRGVPLLLSSDSHRREMIGRYEHATAVVRQLAEMTRR